MFRFGLYGIGLNVQAEYSLTESGNATGTPNTFTQYLCVKDFEPFANFWAISAQTVPATYKEETNFETASALLVDTEPPVHLPDATNNFVSGYAPNLTVWFRESSEAHGY